MSRQATEVSIRKSIIVDVGREHAFDVFTRGFDSWWLRDHSIGKSEMAEAVIEPRQGGRWYEKGVDGSECDWGKVLAWEPPRRLVLAWQISAEWRYDPDLVTEVEVTFTPEGSERTRVDFEHRNLERYGNAREQVRATFESEGGWTGLLTRFAERAQTSA